MGTSSFAVKVVFKPLHVLLIVVLVAAMSLFVILDASAHTPKVDANCSAGAYASGSNYEAKDTNTLTVTVDGASQSKTFKKDGYLAVPIPQDGLPHTWNTSVTTTNKNPAYSTSNSGTITCGDRAKPDKPAPIVVTTPEVQKFCTTGVEDRNMVVTTDWTFDTASWTWVKGNSVTTYTPWVKVRDLTDLEKVDLGCSVQTTSTTPPPSTTTAPPTTTTTQPPADSSVTTSQSCASGDVVLTIHVLAKRFSSDYVKVAAYVNQGDSAPIAPSTSFTNISVGDNLTFQVPSGAGAVRVLIGTDEGGFASQWVTIDRSGCSTTTPPTTPVSTPPSTTPVKTTPVTTPVKSTPVSTPPSTTPVKTTSSSTSVALTCPSHLPVWKDVQDKDGKVTSMAECFPVQTSTSGMVSTNKQHANPTPEPTHNGGPGVRESSSSAQLTGTLSLIGLFILAGFGFALLRRRRPASRQH